MLGNYFSLNGELLPKNKARISIENIAFSYGFGVYENIRLRKGKAYFLNEHLNRLLHSAEVIGLGHDFNVMTMSQWVNETIAKNKIKSANVKMLLIGGAEPQLYIMPLAPRYPDKKMYREGVKIVPYVYERFLPQAKTLNMLPSYLAYSEAKKQGAYDALFVDYHGYTIEGTRSNFFVLRGKILYTAPVGLVLDGVTRRTVIVCAKKHGYKLVEKKIKYKDIGKYDSAFLTNSSGKIVPIGQVENRKMQVSEELKRLMMLYEKYIENTNKIRSKYK